jgi:C_GCAxxG_C_C family probable redox protein
MREENMSKTETALKIFETCNCAQAVITAYAEAYGLEKDKALQVAAGFGGGMGRLQEVCGAVSGAVMVLGLSSGFKEGDGREKINSCYALVRSLIADFTARKGSVKCLELLEGCKLLTDEGQKQFKEKKLREKCEDYIRLACELLDKYLAD